MKRATVDLNDAPLPRPAQVRFLSGDADVEPRQLRSPASRRTSIALISAPLRARSSGSPAYRAHRGGEPSCAPPPAECSERVSEGPQGDPFKPDGFPDVARERPFRRPRSLVQQRSRDGGDRDALESRRLAREGAAAVDEEAPMASGAARSRPRDRFQIPLKARQPVRADRAGVAQRAARACQRRSHPEPPVVVRQDRSDRKDALLDDHEPTRRHPMAHGVIREPELGQLAPRHAVELPAGESSELSVPHTPL